MPVDLWRGSDFEYSQAKGAELVELGRALDKIFGSYSQIPTPELRREAFRALAALLESARINAEAGNRRLH